LPDCLRHLGEVSLQSVISASGAAVRGLCSALQSIIWMLLATGAGALYFGAALWLGWAGFAALPIGRPLIRRSQPTVAVTPSSASPVSPAR
jgi:hypothetical protein